MEGSDRVPEWLNYHHLRYFHAVAQEGSVRGASDKLRTSQPSICAQVKQLEVALGEKLYRRSGRSIALTDFGRLIYGYAEEIFALGRELLTTAEGAALRLRLENDGTVGVQLRLWVEVFDHEGYSLGRYSPQMATMTLLPGGSGERHVSLADLPPGTYDCLVIADNEDQNVFGARYQIEIAPPAPALP
jgi:molybdenum-dependent DNA-binding transcriptional regulator ModE